MFIIIVLYVFAQSGRKFSAYMPSSFTSICFLLQHKYTNGNIAINALVLKSSGFFLYYEITNPLTNEFARQINGVITK